MLSQSTTWTAHQRIEVFDDQGNFVVANQSYIPNLSHDGAPITVANFRLAGFDVYFGDPRVDLVGFL